MHTCVHLAIITDASEMLIVEYCQDYVGNVCHLNLFNMYITFVMCQYIGNFMLAIMCV